MFLAMEVERLIISTNIPIKDKNYQRDFLKELDRIAEHTSCRGSSFICKVDAFVHCKSSAPRRLLTMFAIDICGLGRSSYNLCGPARSHNPLGLSPPPRCGFDFTALRLWVSPTIIRGIAICR